MLKALRYYRNNAVAVWRHINVVKRRCEKAELLWPNECESGTAEL